MTESRSELTRESSKFDGGTYTLRSKSGDRKSLIDDGRWLSLDRKGKTSKTGLVTSSSSSAVASQQSSSAQKNVSRESKKSHSRSPSRAKSQEKDAGKDESGDARAFWVGLDSSSQSQEQRKSSRVSQEKKTSKKMSRSSTERKVSKEPPVDYNNEKKNSTLKRGSQVSKKRKENVATEESKMTDSRYNMKTVNNNDYNRGATLGRDGDYPLVKTGQTSEFSSDTLKKNSNSMSRRGTIYDENINRDGFGRDINNANNNNALVKRNRSNSNADESKHFLSLQLFNKVVIKVVSPVTFLDDFVFSTQNLHSMSFFPLKLSLNWRQGSVRRRMLCTGNFYR